MYFFCHILHHLNIICHLDAIDAKMCKKSECLKGQISHGNKIIGSVIHVKETLKIKWPDGVQSAGLQNLVASLCEPSATHLEGIWGLESIQPGMSTRKSFLLVMPGMWSAKDLLPRCTYIASALQTQMSYGDPSKGLSNQLRSGYVLLLPSESSLVVS